MREPQQVVPIEENPLFPTKKDLSFGDVRYYREFLNSKDARRLFAAVDREVASSRQGWRQDHIVMFGKRTPLPRLTAWFGDPGFGYTYSGIRMDPEPWTPGIAEIKEHAERVAGVEFNSVLLNQYRNGADSVSWHSDDEPEIARQNPIASVSLGETRIFKLKGCTNETGGLKTKLELEAGSLLIMAGATQKHWQHEVPRQKSKSNPWELPLSRSKTKNLRRRRLQAVTPRK